LPLLIVPTKNFKKYFLKVAVHDVGQMLRITFSIHLNVIYIASKREIMSKTINSIHTNPHRLDSCRDKSQGGSGKHFVRLVLRKLHHPLFPPHKASLCQLLYIPIKYDHDLCLHTFRHLLLSLRKLEPY